MNDVKMVSIDGATHITGMAYFVNGKLRDYGKIDLSNSGKDIDDRLLEMGEKMLKALDIWKPSIIYIEQPQGNGNNIRTSGYIHELIGFAKAWAVKNYAYCEEVPPSVWRKCLGLKQGRNIKNKQLKQESINAVIDMFGINTTDDIADAICLGTAMLNKYSD